MDNKDVEKKGQGSAITAQNLEEPTLDTLVGSLNSIKIIQDYLNDQVIQDLSKILSSVSKLLNAISATDFVDIIERALQDPDLDRALINPPRAGLVGILRALSDEEVQKGMGILLRLLKALGKASSSV